MVDISLTVSPVRNAQGKVIGASKIARDITEHKRSEAQIVNLAREAEHRTKNILATVLATVRLSNSDTSDDLKQLIEGRISALAKVHTLFVESRWAGAELHRLATQELLAYSGEKDARVRIDGPAVMLEPSTAQASAISLHELATNAAKKIGVATGSGWSRGDLLVPYSRRKAQLALDRVGWATRHAAHAPRVRHTHYGKYNWPARG